MIFLDIETYSPVPIAHGAYRYREQAEVILLTWARDDSEVHIIEPGRGDLEYFRSAAIKEDIVTHGPFDRLHLGFPVEWHVDVVAMAHAHGLPGKLEKLCEILNLPLDQRKLEDGRRLIQIFCKPQTGKDGQTVRATKHTHPAEWDRFKDYARQDIVSMREVYKRIPRWNYPDNRFERRLYEIDQRINDRGMRVDVEFARRVVEAVARQQRKVSDRVEVVTDGAVQSANQRDEMLRHMLDVWGVSLPDLTKSTVQRRLEDPELPLEVKELLELRLETATASSAKYTTLMRSVSSDGRLRGTMTFCGAVRTGRWAGSKFQPHNMARPTWAWEATQAWIECVLAFGDAPDTKFGSREAVRSCVVAPEGGHLGVVDWANIEGRLGAWAGGEAWKLRAFRDFDEGSGPDLYLLAYAKAFGVPIAEARRDVGKVIELALQYEGGVGAFVTFATVYGVDIEVLTSEVQIPEWARVEATWLYDNRHKFDLGTYGLSRQAWITCDAIKRLWRAQHPGIVQTWAGLAACWQKACAGEECSAGAFTFDKVKSWLRIELPSGRFLSYPGARADAKGLSYMGLNQYSKQWERIYTHGGKIFENIVQAMARDVLADALVRLDKAKIPVVLHVHDEPVAEVKNEAELFVMEDICTEELTWAPGLPLAVKGSLQTRYHKT